MAVPFQLYDCVLDFDTPRRRLGGQVATGEGAPVETKVIFVQLFHFLTAEVVNGREERFDLVKRAGLRPQVEVHTATHDARLTLIENDVPLGVHPHRGEVDFDLVTAECDVLIARVDVALAAPERVLHPLLVDRVERDEVPGRRCLGGNRRAGQEGSGETDHGSEAAGRPHQRREWNATCKPLCQPPSLPAAVF